MKTKFLLPIALIFFTATVANAQINEGRYLLGGSVSYIKVKNLPYSVSKSESFYSNIQFGKVIKDNTVAGIIASYGSSKNEPGNTSSNFSAGIFYRKYKSLAKNFYFFGEGDLVYSHSKSTYENFQPVSDVTRSTSNGAGISFVLGISYSLCKRMQIELSMPTLASISYGSIKTETQYISPNTTTTEKGNSFSANVNLNSNLLSNFGIGFKFFLGK
ncbi:MAG: hypothetical protein ABI091_22940 [Ferruginibacter sp.]